MLLSLNINMFTHMYIYYYNIKTTAIWGSGWRELAHVLLRASLIVRTPRRLHDQIVVLMCVCVCVCVSVSLTVSVYLSLSVSLSLSLSCTTNTHTESLFNVSVYYEVYTAIIE